MERGLEHVRRLPCPRLPRLTRARAAGETARVSWRDAYRDRLATPAEAAALVRSGDTVAVASFSNTPHTLCRALAARRRELRDVRVEHLASLFPWDEHPDPHGQPPTLVTNYATAAHRAPGDPGP